MELKEKMEINSNVFYGISIRGRVSYGIHCLKHVIECSNSQLNVDERVLSFLISMLESYVKVDFHENLEVKFRELTPCSILEDHPDNIFSEYKCYTINQLRELDNLYRSLPEYINDIIDGVIEIILCNLYTDIQKSHAPCSLEELSYIFKILNENMIDLPKIPKYVLESKFNQEKGRGFPIDLP